MLAFRHAGLPPLQCVWVEHTVPSPTISVCPLAPAMQLCGCVAARVCSLGSLIAWAHTAWARGILWRVTQVCKVSSESVVGCGSPPAHADSGPASMVCVHIVPKSFPVESRKYKHWVVTMLRARLALSVFGCLTAWWLPRDPYNQPWESSSFCWSFRHLTLCQDGLTALCRYLCLSYTRSLCRRPETKLWEGRS